MQSDIHRALSIMTCAVVRSPPALFLYHILAKNLAMTLQLTRARKRMILHNHTYLDSVPYERGNRVYLHHRWRLQDGFAIST